MRPYRIALAAAWVLALTLHAQAGDPSVDRVEVVGTEFRIIKPDGQVLTGPDLIGTVLTIADPSGASLAVRIDAVQPDPKDPSGEITLYAFMIQNPATGVWENLCQPDAEGLAMGFPLAGTWTAAGEHLPSATAFGLTCTSGASGKCVRMGYKPWATAPDGTLLWDHHQACERMVRADYCGDGVSHTRDGMAINVYDPLGIQVADPEPAMSFEAGWGVDGATCVRHVRIPEAASLEELVGACPDRLQGRTGEACSEAWALGSPETLILNASVPLPAANSLSD